MEDLDRALKLEWLETNGLGGFASSTVTGANTRRYHGLLMAATKPPVGRMLLLSKLEETLDGQALATNCYPGAVHPEGYRYLREFCLDPFPVFVFEVNGLVLEKRVFMVQGENTTVVEYELREGGRECTLVLRPLIAFRDYHSTTHRNDGLNASVEPRDGMAVVAPYAGVPAMYLAHSPAKRGEGHGWYMNFEFERERERGLDFREDLFNPLALTFTLKPGVPVAVIASTEPRAAGLAPELSAREVRRRTSLANGAAPLVRELTTAAGQFIVKRGDLQTIIAGYHWFSDWGRDTMIALPGLTLATGRHDVARRILVAFAGSMDRGMLPNRFPDAGETPEYNTVDATLWFFEAARAYVKYTGDYDFIRQSLYAKLRESIDWHLRGTRYGIRVDRDALLACGEQGVQLTWMDAKIGDWVVTPRHGKPVEIQALWYNALRTLEEMARQFGDCSSELFLRELADLARTSFRAQFWNEQDGCLYDVVNGEERDASIRPNQIFAVSLPYTMLEQREMRAVVGVVERELRTPAGLRTLSRNHPQYRSRYEGDVPSRDSAYHQGTVWPWLLGPFLTAYLRAGGAREQATRWLDEFQEYLQANTLGLVPEIADAEAPHTPRGCVAQAWSVGELLRAAVEDVYVALATAAGAA